MVIFELRQKYNVNKLINVACIARSTYYYILKKLNKEDKYTFLKREISNIFHYNKGRYGYRRITMALHNKGIKINHKTVRKIMKKLDLICKVRMKKYKSYKAEQGLAAPNILKRDFNATAPNKKWVTDITEFALLGTKVYLSPILDLYNGEIISYEISMRPVFKQVTDMLKTAFGKIPNDTGIVLHSDQGWQYRMRKYQELLKQKGVCQSMSRKGNCLDNAVIENFFGLLKTELFYLQEFSSVDEFIMELKEYIIYYNNDRIKAKLKGLSPIQYRKQSFGTAS